MRQSEVDTNGKREPDLRGVVADFLANLSGVGQKKDSRNSDAVTQMETRVTGGSIQVEELSGGEADIYYSPDRGTRIPIRLAGSMVSELAPIDLFLRYLVETGDLVIIEEPEAHLHPAAQFELAAVLARLARAGVQVLITTHSSVLLGRINNLIAAHSLTPKQRAAEGISTKDTIDPATVAAYELKFAPHATGTMAGRLDVSASEGIPEDVFVDVIEELYAETIHVSSELERSAPDTR